MIERVLTTLLYFNVYFLVVCILGSYLSILRVRRDSDLFRSVKPGSAVAALPLKMYLSNSGMARDILKEVIFDEKGNMGVPSLQVLKHEVGLSRMIRFALIGAILLLGPLLLLSASPSNQQITLLVLSALCLYVLKALDSSWLSIALANLDIVSELDKGPGNTGQFDDWDDDLR